MESSPGSQRAWVIVVLVPDGDFYPEEFQSTLNQLGLFSARAFKCSSGGRWGCTHTQPPTQ